MIDREKVVEGLTHCTAWAGLHECQPKFGPDCPYEDDADCKLTLMRDALAMLKEQEGYVSVPFSWLVKFCTHIDFVEPLTDAEREVAWRQKLRQQFGINASKKAAT